MEHEKLSIKTIFFYVAVKLEIRISSKGSSFMLVGFKSIFLAIPNEKRHQICFTGHETKAMLNNSGPRYKRSKLERMMNWDIVWCVVILLVLCFIGAVGE